MESGQASLTKLRNRTKRAREIVRHRVHKNVDTVLVQQNQPRWSPLLLSPFFRSQQVVLSGLDSRLPSIRVDGVFCH